MKTIKLKVYKEKVDQTEVVLTTFSLLKSAVTQAPQGGWEIEDMRRHMRVLGKLDEVQSDFEYNGVLAKAPEGYLDKVVNLQLEDADYNTVKTAWKRMRWGLISQAILDTDEEFK